MANFEAFLQSIKLSTNFLFLKSGILGTMRFQDCLLGLMQYMGGEGDRSIMIQGFIKQNRAQNWESNLSLFQSYYCSIFMDQLLWKHRRYPLLVTTTLCRPDGVSVVSIHCKLPMSSSTIVLGRSKTQNLHIKLVGFVLVL